MYKKHLSLLEEFPTEETAKQRRAELDEKYPFEPADDVIVANETEEFDQDEVVVPDVKPIIKTNEPKEERKNVKFEQLAFGDNYDVE